MSYNSASQYQGEDTNPRHPWLQSLWEARRSAREAYASIAPDVGTDQTVFAPDAQQLAHIFLIDYVRHIRPIATNDASLQDLWTDPLYETTIPQPASTYAIESSPMLYGTNDDTDAGVDIETAVNGLPTTTREISLDTVLSYWDTQNEVRFFIEGDDGREARRVAICLPRGAIGACLQQADLCLDDLNWLPDSAVDDYTAGESEVLRHE